MRPRGAEAADRSLIASQNGPIIDIERRQAGTPSQDIPAARRTAAKEITTDPERSLRDGTPGAGELSMHGREWSLEHVHIVGVDSELVERIAETFRGDGWTTSVSADTAGFWEMREEWDDHRPDEPLGVIFAVRRNDDLKPRGLASLCEVLSLPRTTQPWFVLGVMTDDVTEIRQLGVDVVVPYGEPAETMLDPMRTALEKRRVLIKQRSRMRRWGENPSA